MAAYLAECVVEDAEKGMGVGSAECAVEETEMDLVETEKEDYMVAVEMVVMVMEEWMAVIKVAGLELDLVETEVEAVKMVVVMTAVGD